MANLRRPDEPHAISAALSTATNRSFVTFNGINDVLESRLPAALANEHARHVHFAFYPRACATWESHVLRLRDEGVTTSWDFGWNEALVRDRRFPHLLRALDYVFLNEQEAVLYSRRHDLEAAVAMWRDAPMHVIVKLGPRGSRWLGRDTDLEVPTRRGKVVDTTGAGDAFNGGFLTGLLRGFSPTRVPPPRQLRRHPLDAQRRRPRRPAGAGRPARGLRVARGSTCGHPGCAPGTPAPIHPHTMKLAIIGGAGVRVPLLVNGLVQSDLPIADIALYDVDRDRLRLIGDLAARLHGFGAPHGRRNGGRGCRGRRLRLHQHSRRRHRGPRPRRGDCARARHRRAGDGRSGRLRDGRCAPSRTRRYAREVDRARAHGAWIINFTNPVGIVTQAVRTATARA